MRLSILSITLSLLATIAMTRFRHAVNTGPWDQYSKTPSSPSLQRLSIACAVLVGFAGSLGYTAALWQHVSAASIASLVDRLGRGAIVAHVGTEVTVLTWLSCLLLSATFVGSIGTVVAIYYIRHI